MAGFFKPESTLSVEEAAILVAKASRKHRAALEAEKAAVIAVGEAKNELAHARSQMDGAMKRLVARS